MDKHIYDEKNGLGYTLYGDYSVYRDYIWVRSEKERISLFLSLSNKEFIFISFYGKLT